MPQAPAAVVEALRAACAELAPTPDHGELLNRVAAILQADTRLSLIDDGWYRVGALVDAQGRKIAEDLEAWAVAECGGDVVELYARYADSDYWVTGTIGRTLYLTAPVGPGPLDFVQVEVDEAQDVVERRLFVGDEIPDLLADLLEPAGKPRPTSAPRYGLRKVSAFAHKAAVLTGEHSGDPRFSRFVAEWTASTAGRSRRFCDHWVLSVVPYRDSDGEHLLEAKPIPTARVDLPDLARLRAAEIDYHPSRAARAIDLQAGYPMAWYFLQVAAHYAPYRCIVDVRDDFRSPPPDVTPLPPDDMRLVDNWVEVPYNFH